MEPTSLISHPYTLMHQQQQEQHQQRQHLSSSQQQPQSPQASTIYDQHQHQHQQQQQGGVQSGGMLSRPVNMNSNSSNSSTIGQKRDFSGNPVNANSQDSQDGGKFVKLFVGSVPRTITEEEVQPMFTEHGNVLEVALIKDKRTGQQQGCCFVKYGAIEEAERAIRALNNQRILPGGTAPVQVRYADGERERLGAVEHKLFVGSLNKAASEKEIEELFVPYGRVDDVYIMRDEQKQSRGCAFIKYPTREMATAAINALNGIYIMPGCDQALAVRFADPKRPKGGDARVGGPGFGGAGFNVRTGAVGNRIAPAPVSQVGVRGTPMGGWRPMGGPGMVPQPQMALGSYGASLGPRGGLSSVPMGYYQQNAERQRQASTQAYGQVPAAQQQSPQQSAQQILLMQSPQLSQGQGPPQLQQQMQQPRQLQPPQQQLQSQHLQPQQRPQNIMHSHPHPQQQTPQQQPQQVYYQIPSIQQSQQQPSWVLPVQQHAVSNLPTPPTLPTSCEWTEHTSPEGFKYYYNSSIAESKWEKPEELVAFEQQQAAQSHLHAVTTPGSPGANLFVFRIRDDFTDETVISSVPEWTWKGKAGGEDSGL